MAKLNTVEKNRRTALKLVRAIKEAQDRAHLAHRSAKEADREAAAAEVQALQLKLSDVTLPCPGEAHRNPFIDHCMTCLKCTWGRVPRS